MNKSFTLIEILVAIVVIGILSSFILIGMSSITEQANFAKGKAFINSMDNSLLLGRVSQWKFDERTTAGHGDTFIDLWGSNTGTLYTNNGTNNKVSSDCPSGNCLSFDGTDDYVDIGNHIFIDGTTFSIWFKSTNTLSQMPFGGDNGFFVYVYSTQIQGSTDGSSAGSPTYTGTVCDGNWHHLVLMSDGSRAWIYFDGLNILNWTETSTKTSHQYAVGRYHRVETGAYYSFNGLIDDVRIYNVAIPTSQIQQNYYIGLNNLYKNNGITQIEYNQRITGLKFNLSQN